MCLICSKAQRAIERKQNVMQFYTSTYPKIWTITHVKCYIRAYQNEALFTLYLSMYNALGQKKNVILA